MSRLVLLACLLLVACDNGNVNYIDNGISVKPLSEIKANLAFTCVHETIPAASPEAEVLFQYARWLQKNNQLKQEKNVDAEVERLYRIAAENGHSKANINLQNGGLRAQFTVVGHEYLRLSQALIDDGVATGYYFVGVFLRSGSAGLKKDELMSLRYFRKAADEGSAQAQYLVAEKLASSDAAPEVAQMMYRCAAEQGHGRSALTLGVDRKYTKVYDEALEAFQLGVAAGNANSASFLNHGFSDPYPTDELYYLGLPVDLERADRYEKIWSILADYSYANPKVPEINDIVPLPPAKLPPWDGKLKWLEEREANIPPEKPSQELIQRLADEKQLHPATGRPLPGSPLFSQAHLSASDCRSGERCSVSGYWQVRADGDFGTPNGRPIIRHFSQGELFPTEQMLRYTFRNWPFTTKITKHETIVRWRLA